MQGLDCFVQLMTQNVSDLECMLCLDIVLLGIDLMALLMNFSGESSFRKFFVIFSGALFNFFTSFCCGQALAKTLRLA